MTKRFSFYAEKIGQHYEISIRDDEELKEYNVTDDFFKSKDVLWKVVGLLNTLHEENKELKRCVRCDPNEIESMVKEIHCLKEENEQLQKKVKVYEIFLEMNDLNIDWKEIDIEKIIGDGVWHFVKEWG